MLADLDYVTVAYVRGGRLAVIETVLFHLHTLGVIFSGRQGSIRREHTGLRLEGIERVISNAVVGTVAPFALSGRPRVDEALKEVRACCVTTRLIRRGVPAGLPLYRRRTGRNLLTTLRSNYPLDSGEDLTMLVALYGRDALLRYAERFASESGLMNRSGSDNFGDEAGPQGRSGLDGM